MVIEEEDITTETEGRLIIEEKIIIKVVLKKDHLEIENLISIIEEAITHSTKDLLEIETEIFSIKPIS